MNISAVRPGGIGGGDAVAHGTPNLGSIWLPARFTRGAPPDGLAHLAADQGSPLPVCHGSSCSDGFGEKFGADAIGVAAEDAAATEAELPGMTQDCSVGMALKALASLAAVANSVGGCSAAVPLMIAAKGPCSSV